MTGYPMTHWAVRRAILSCIFGPNYTFRWKWHILCSFGIVLSTLVVGILSPSLEAVFDLVGCTSSTWLIFGLPAVLGWRLRILRKSQCIALCSTAFLIATVGIFVNFIGAD